MSENYHITEKECPKHKFDELWFVPASDFTPKVKIQEIIDYIENEYDTNDMTTPDYYEGLDFCLGAFKELMGDSDE